MTDSARPRDFWVGVTGIILAALALILSIGALALDLWQDRRLSALETESRRLEFRPIVAVQSVDVEEYEVRAPRIAVKELTSRDADTLTIAATLRLRAKVKLTNTGNAVARMLARVCSDTATGQPILRSILRDPKLRRQRLRLQPSSDFFPVTDLAPGDSATVYVDSEVQHVDAAHFTLHLLLLYENEAGSLFDTYSWTRYKLNEILTEFLVTYDQDGKPWLRVVYDRRQLIHCLSRVDGGLSHDYYTASEATSLLADLQSWQEP